MPQLIRHQLGATLLDELRQEGLGVRDLFEGRQEPLSWYFRGVAYDQSELDILESGAVHTLHAPSALVELVVDEMALACANLGLEGVASYLDMEALTEGPEGSSPEEAGGAGAAAGPEGPPVPGTEEPPVPGTEEGSSPEETEPPRRVPLPDGFAFAPDVALGYLNVDVAPPAVWLEEREAGAEANERLATRLAEVAQEIGDDADTVEVHIEGALAAGAESGWVEGPSAIRPAGVSLYYSFDLPLAEATERQLAQIFGRGASTASATLERMRDVFREG